MSKIFKIFLSLILVILIFNKKIISYYYIKKFSSWVERPVEISHLNFEYSGHIEVEDIRILNSNKGYYQNIFQADRISFNIDVKSLFSQLVIINNLDITNPEFYLDVKIFEKKKENIGKKEILYDDNLGLAKKLSEKTPDKIWPKKDKDVNFIIKKSVLSGATANIKVSSISDPVKINLSEMMFSNFGNERGYQHYKDILKIILFDLYASMENERIKETLKQVYNF